MRKHTFQNGFAMLGFVMVVATITVVGVVAFRFLDAQDNTEVATQAPKPVAEQVATVETPKDVESITTELEAVDQELNAIDAELNTEFAF